MDKLAYLLKHRFPAVFRGVESVARWAVTLRYGRRLTYAKSRAVVMGKISGRPATMQALNPDKAETLYEFLQGLPREYMRYFQPHSFDLDSLTKVLRSRAFLNYGLFVDKRLIAYGLLKVAPTGSAFIGLLVHPQFAGRGLGKFMVAYLYWQASVAGLRVRSTISRLNPGSLRSHQAVSEFKVVAVLPNDYMLIEFPRGPVEQPKLEI